MKGTMLKTENKKGRSKQWINGVFDGKNKANRAKANTSNLVKEKSP